MTLAPLEPAAQKRAVRAEIHAALPAYWGRRMAEAAATPDESGALHSAGHALESRRRAAQDAAQERRETRKVSALMRRLGPALRVLREQSMAGEAS